MDQLTPNDYKNTDKWMLTELPSNAKLIVSTLPDHGNLLDIIYKIIGKKFNEIVLGTSTPEISSSISITSIGSSLYDKSKEFIDKQILHVNELSAQEAELVLGNWLIAANRKLTDSQWQDLKDLFKNSEVLPLFLKLVYDIVVKWRSYEDKDERLSVCFKIDHIIKYMFERLERTHGNVIFRRALSYMTICKNGISDTELEDILSLDDDVLYSVFQFHMPPIRRLPPILWIRIKKDLGEYLVEKEANDTKVIYWYHRRFVEVSLSHYINSLKKSEKQILFQNIFDFFNETWKGKQKPFELNEYLKKKLKSTGTNSADRYLSSQPLKYTGEDGSIKYNKRKLSELPNCLANLNSIFALEKACELVFYNYEFMHAKFVCESINEVYDDLETILSNESSYGYSEESKMLLNQLRLFSKCLNLCGNRINDYPPSLGFELTSRLLNYYGILKYVTKLIDESDRESFNDCSFISPYLQQHPPGGFLVSSVTKHTEPILDIMLINNFILSISRSKINVYGFSSQVQQIFLFDIKLPTDEKLRDYISGHRDKVASKMEIKKSAVNRTNLIDSRFVVKSIYDTESIKENISNEYDSVNRETFPIQFLIVRNDLCYVYTADQQIKFVYNSKMTSGLEILDAFCLGLRQIIVAEKKSSVLKIFPDYELGWKKVNEFNINEGNSEATIKDIRTTANVYQTKNDFEIDILVWLTNDVLKQYIIRHERKDGRESVSTDDSSEFEFDYYRGDYESVRFETESETESESGSDDEDENNSAKFKPINKHLSYYLVRTIKNPGFDIENVLKIQNTNFWSFLNSNSRSQVGRIYMCMKNEDFIIINPSSENPTAYLFKNLTDQPIEQIIPPIQNREDENFWPL